MKVMGARLRIICVTVLVSLMLILYGRGDMLTWLSVILLVAYLISEYYMYRLSRH